MAQSESCEHKWIPDAECHVCVLCGLLDESNPIRELAYREIIPRRHDTYVSHEYVSKKCAQLTGIEKDLPLQPYQWKWELEPQSKLRWIDPEHDLDRRLHKCATWMQVYRLLKEFGVEHRYLQIGARLGYPVIATKGMRNILNCIVYSTAKVQMLYVMYKVYELQGLDKRIVPLRQRQKTLNAADNEWWYVCEEFGVPFRYTYERDLHVPWRK